MRSRLGWLISLLALDGCQDPKSPPEPSNLSALTTLRLRGDAGSSQDVAVRVTDRFGNGVANTQVSWTASDNGTANPEQSTTDASGVARTIWQLGTRVDVTQSLTARVPGLTDVRIEADAVVPAAVRITISGNNQSGEVGVALPTPVSLVLKLADGRPIQGAAVHWEVPPEGGVKDPNPTTDASGRAQAIWQLRPHVGSQLLNAFVAGRQVAFVATARPGPVSQLDLWRTTITIMPGGSEKILARGRDRFSNSIAAPSVAWVSSNEAVATVSSDGIVLAVSAGSAKVRAESDGVRSEASITVIPYSASAPAVRSARAERWFKGDISMVSVYVEVSPRGSRTQVTFELTACAFCDGFQVGPRVLAQTDSQYYSVTATMGMNYMQQSVRVIARNAAGERTIIHFGIQDAPAGAVNVRFVLAFIHPPSPTQGRAARASDRAQS